MKDVIAVILAAGKGKRMHSDQAKTLHKVGDRTILDWMLDACQLAGIENVIVVVGPHNDDIRQHLQNDGHALTIELATQNAPLGTADAVRAAFDQMKASKARYAMILPGDMPNIQAATLKRMMLKRAQKSINCLTVSLDEPAAYGRIIRNSDGTVAKIVEFKDCAPEQIAIREIGTATYSVPIAFLETALPQIQNDNAAHEYYFTDIIEIANKEGMPVNAVVAESAGEVMGVNSPEELVIAQNWRKKLSL